jgi:hypothetical protein
MVQGMGMATPDIRPALSIRRRYTVTLTSLPTAGLVEADAYDPCPGCYAHRIGGRCSWCEYTRALCADPAYAAMSDAQFRMDNFGTAEGYTPELAKADAKLVVTYERAKAIVERAATIVPNGCARCGAEQRGHAWRYGGQHREGAFKYESPTDAQRLRRMRARRAHQSGRLYEVVGTEFQRLHAQVGA